MLPKVEGLQYESPEWLLLDAGSVVVHIFTQALSALYFSSVAVQQPMPQRNALP